MKELLVENGTMLGSDDGPGGDDLRDLCVTVESVAKARAMRLSGPDTFRLPDYNTISVPDTTPNITPIYHPILSNIRISNPPCTHPRWIRLLSFHILEHFGIQYPPTSKSERLEIPTSGHLGL
jgi:hypothetical protein